MKEKNLSRRQLLLSSGAVGLAVTVPGSLRAAWLAASHHHASSGQKPSGPAATPNPLKPPASGAIPVAFVISKGAVLIDFAGPWEVFNNADIPDRDMMDPAFELYTVAETMDPIKVSGGMNILPNYTFKNAPPPKIIVIPAQRDASDVMLDWIR